ncbi:ribosome biogenesis GTPase Der [Methyloceanibacter methanicus]|uniref:GTPase Der n=1 Tax=Methyloceanibacter methanicus TaxID=1774968 RepID=A0A1E3VYA4_9HYPH|nr:ribosome biogenesis GTPase Der [Methyloceanibacter methanicus]ODR98527.1 ribosome biogenesis GTPase Der [Methyloceanibacter methanicus]
MPFTVAIVGRPNVGKSTLFNRLAGRKLALVDDQPGLTRDRREADVVLEGCPLTLIDTAGLESGDDGLTARMRLQTEAAIAQADLVLFIIDARVGVTAADEIFADLVRKAGKTVVLAANKSEGRSAEPGYYEAFSLGLGEPLAISAEHGLGIGDVTEAIAEAYRRAQGETSAEAGPEEGEPDEEGVYPLRIAIAGRPNVGKSTLVNALLGEDRMITGPEAGITRDAIATEIVWGSRRLRVFDTAGLRRKARIDARAEVLSVGDTLRAIKFAEVVVLLLDAEQPFEKQDLQIADLIAQEGRALVIAVNKWDLVSDKQARLAELREMCQRLLPQVKGVSLVTLSAQSGKGVDKLMDAVLAADAVWNRRLPTAALNDWLAGMIDAHAPPAVAGRRLKIRYMTQANARPPTFVAFCSQPKALPDSYVRYLVNGLRETFDLPGVPIRFNLRKGTNPYVKAKS